jgi:hypothetical protein
MTSTQDMVRPGEPMDLYYYDGETSRKQAFPTTVNTKFVQNFQTLTGGSSTFTIPPSNGIQDILCQFVLAVTTTNANTAIPSAWGYALIKQVSFRYGGSSQYFLTGDQLLQLALMKQSTSSAMNDIVNLGGNAQLGVTGSTNLFANVVLTLPHSTPSGVGKALPFPTDLLTQQVQVTVELFPVSAILTGSGLGSAGITLSSAQFCVQQVMLNNQADALARRVDMSVNAYAFPAQFVQQKQTINLGAGTSGNCGQPQSGSGIPVTLTGFRSGEVKAIAIWLTLANDFQPNTAGNITCAPFNWYLPTSAQMTYAGDVYARFDNAGSVLWNLVNDNKSPAVSTVGYTAGTPPAQESISSAYNSGLTSWVILPFSQAFVDEDEHHVLVHGKPITNGIVNLLVSPPAVATAIGGDTWVLNVSYIYNTTLLMSQGSADFVF